MPRIDFSSAIETIGDLAGDRHAEFALMLRDEGKSHSGVFNPQMTLATCSAHLGDITR